MDRNGATFVLDSLKSDAPVPRNAGRRYRLIHFVRTTPFESTVEHALPPCLIMQPELNTTLPPSPLHSAAVSGAAEVGRGAVLVWDLGAIFAGVEFDGATTAPLGAAKFPLFTAFFLSVCASTVPEISDPARHATKKSSFDDRICPSP
jgi:hypothetical protein